VLSASIEPPQGGRFVLGGSLVGDFAISPDGKTIAYTASVDGKAGLWIRQLDGSSAKQLPGTENAGQPFWSPDGRYIGFVQLGTALRVADVSGGTPVTVCKGYGMRAGSFTKDGSILFSALTSGKAGVFLVSASGGAPSLVTAPDESRGEMRYRWPKALPDGQFLYSVEGTKDDISGVYAASLRNPAEHVKLLTTTSTAAYATGPDGKGFLLWTRGGTLVAQQFEPRNLRFAGQPHVIADTLHQAADSDMHLSASNGLLLYGTFRDVTQFAWFDREGKPLTPVGEPLSYVSMFRLSPDDRHIAVQTGVVQAGSAGISDLWLVDTERGGSNRFTDSAAAGSNTQPVWSPDGRTILFVHLGSPELVRKAARGIGNEQLVARRPAEVMPTDWSRDGRWVLTRERGADTGFDIWKIPVTSDGRTEPGATPSPYVRTKFNEQGARFSPELNPRWVAYASDESGRYEVHIDSFPERRGKIPLSTGGGLHPMWGAADELFYVRPEDNALMSVALKVTSEAIEPSTPVKLFTLPLRSPAGATYQPSRAGQRFLVLTEPESGPPLLNLIVNWPALVKKDGGVP
jgi:Tol biopolymer transport system component